MNNPFDGNSYVDTREIEEYIEELESSIEEVETQIEDLETEIDDLLDDEEDGNIEEVYRLEKNREVLKDSISYELEELEELRQIREEVPEWYYGNTLISEDEWVAYVEELLKDCGDLPNDIPWYIEIDWEKTAENVAVDYSKAEYKGHTYYYRSC